MSIRKKIEEIMNSNKGKVFILKDFFHLGCKNTVKSAMLRLCNSGKVKRLLRGVYAIQEYSKKFDCEIEPDIRDIVEKYAMRFNGKIIEVGIRATNKTGACTQVAAKVFLGVNKRLKKELVSLIGFDVKLRALNPRYFVKTNSGNLLIQSLVDFGKRGRRYFSKLDWFVRENKKELLEDDFSNLPFSWLKKAVNNLLSKQFT